MTKEQKEQFNDFRFEGLEHKEASNKYFTMKRVNAEETKIVVKVAPEHLVKTKFGYALVLDKTHVVFLKDWQVSNNFYGIEVLLTKEYFIVKEWGDHKDFSVNEEFLNFEKWVEVAKEQDNLKNSDGWQLNKVQWEK